MNDIGIKKWVSDLEQLYEELPKLHKNMFFKLKRKEFYTQVEELKKNVEFLDDIEISIKVASIVASVKDAHTAVALSIKHLIPFEFYWFIDGIYIITTIPAYFELLNCKVIKINGIAIEKIIRELSLCISYENNSFLMSQLPKYLPAVEILYGLEILDDIDVVEFTVEKVNGDVIVVSIRTGNYLVTKQKLFNNIVDPTCDLPLYRQNKDKNYWSYYIEEAKILYLNYNSCKDMQCISVEHFCEQLLQFIHKGEVDKLVIDLRNNLGGNSTLLEPFIRELKKCEKINYKGGIYVILGRETFSSALLNAYSLKYKTEAIFIGEPTGGKPNCYGEVQYFDLNNSKLRIRYSTQYYKIIKDDKMQSFLPDVNIDVTINDYLNGKDPCMDYILGNY